MKLVQLGVRKTIPLERWLQIVDLAEALGFDFYRAL